MSKVKLDSRKSLPLGFRICLKFRKINVSIKFRKINVSNSVKFKILTIHKSFTTPETYSVFIMDVTKTVILVVGAAYTRLKMDVYATLRRQTLSTAKGVLFWQISHTCCERVE
jgi:hypothetical protein